MADAEHAGSTPSVLARRRGRAGRLQPRFGCAAPRPSALRTAAASTHGAAPTSTHAFAPEIAAGDFAEHVKVLASDAFEGRAPGSAGEEKTVDYLQAQFERMGLQAGQ